MKIPIYQVDAFHDQIFKGNPAAVCPLDEWLPEDIMQSIALENNLSETAFFVREEDNFRIRWFTPVSEVDLCGHATLASAHVLFNHLDYKKDRILFYSLSGPLYVSQDTEDLIWLDFPSLKPQEVKIRNDYKTIFGLKPQSAWKSNKLMLVFDSEETVRSIQPDFRKVAELDDVGVIITSTGNDYDFVSRFFAPAVGIDEDPVTGSAHSVLIPFWAEELGKKKMEAYQASKRGGILFCEDQGERVLIGGNAVTYLEGKISF